MCAAHYEALVLEPFLVYEANLAYNQFQTAHHTKAHRLPVPDHLPCLDVMLGPKTWCGKRCAPQVLTRPKVTRYNVIRT